jgi:hypothetical protein
MVATSQAYGLSRQPGSRHILEKRYPLTGISQRAALHTFSFCLKSRLAIGLILDFFSLMEPADTRRASDLSNS